MIDALHDAGVLDLLDVHFAQAMARLAGESDARLLLAAALASASPRAGNVCVDLPLLTTQAPRDVDGEPLELEWPELDGWLEALRASPLSQGQAAPLVVDPDGRLYLRRYHRYQGQLVEALQERACSLAPDVDAELLTRGLDRLFTSEERDLQRLAAAVAVLRRMAVITGGPGTGKTTTVVRILALLQEQALARGDHALRMVLLAPTGKAAARMGEAIQAHIDGLDIGDDIRATLPREASTIHRALGWLPFAPTRFRHHRDDPLPADVVVVDEASMVDLALMAKLLDAVPPTARLVLLGDKDQLASVEAGAILGDVCHDHDGRISQGFGALVQPHVAWDVQADRDDAGIWDCIVQLERSWRFEASPGIGALARAVNQGQGQASIDAFDQHESLDFIHAEGDAPPEALVGDRLRRGYADYLKTADPVACLEAFNRYRVLCAHRRGTHGSEHLNRVIRNELAQVGAVPFSGDWYHGRPVMVTTNDYGLNLFNGDVGVCLEDPDGSMRVWFSGSDGRPRGLHPARLPAHETVYAMTVHKSQGSEFDRVLLVLPAHASPILTRELVYTGVTRAREQVGVLADADVLREALAQDIQRSSGLRLALWGD